MVVKNSAICEYQRLEMVSTRMFVEQWTLSILAVKVNSNQNWINSAQVLVGRRIFLGCQTGILWLNCFKQLIKLSNLHNIMMVMSLCFKNGFLQVFNVWIKSVTFLHSDVILNFSIHCTSWSIKNLKYWLKILMNLSLMQ